MSDIMDEFEFKPLTDGLGFLKKNNPPVPSPAPTQTPVQSPTSTGGFSSLSTPLPRVANAAAAMATDLSVDLPSTTVDEILKTLNQRKRPEFSSATVKTKIDASPEEPRFKTTSWDASAFLLDLMLVLAMNMLCLIALLLTTKIDLFANLYNPDSERLIFWSLAAMLAGTTWIYLVASRMFLGSTPGEWVFDQRLGLPKETGTAGYSLLVMARATFVLFTGLIVFPVLSLLLSRDVLGRIMGLELMKRV